eukprot:scaffold28_cov155-Amphora_coffeaeformis.AAC.6
MRHPYIQSFTGSRDIGEGRIPKYTPDGMTPGHEIAAHANFVAMDYRSLAGIALAAIIYRSRL